MALPDDARTREQLEWVAGDVEAAGGSAILWHATPIATPDEQHLVQQMTQDRTTEYRELISKVEELHGGGAGDLTRTLARLRRELRRISRRDYFPPPEKEHARQAMDRLTERTDVQASAEPGGSTT